VMQGLAQAHTMRLLFLFCFCVFVGTSTQSRPPIFGILTQPSWAVNDDDVSYAAMSYAKWMDAMGARSVPIVYTDPVEEIECRLAQVDAVILPGGTRGADARQSEQFVAVVKRIIAYAVDSANRGTPLPVFGICMGFQMLLAFTKESLTEKVLEDGFDSGDRRGTLEWTPTAADSRIFGNGSDQPLASAIRARMSQSPPIVYHNHKYGVTWRSFQAFPALPKLWDVLSMSEDRNGRQYISTVESKRGPGMPLLIGFAWHPEKPPFEWSEDVPHGADALAVNRLVGERMVRLAAASSSSRNVTDRHKLLQMLIWNEGTVAVNSSYSKSFEEIFLFSKTSRGYAGYACSGMVSQTGATMESYMHLATGVASGTPSATLAGIAAASLMACLFAACLYFRRRKSRDREEHHGQRSSRKSAALALWRWRAQASWGSWSWYSSSSPPSLLP